MCGILGIIDTISPPNAANALEILLQELFSRGPDGEGTWVEGPVAMGMRRLAVIDVEGGEQPFFNNNKSVVSFQNG